jgi:hypothetical protein
MALTSSSHEQGSISALESLGSDIVATTAGVEMSAFPVHEISVRGRMELLAVRIGQLFGLD